MAITYHCQFRTAEVGALAWQFTDASGTYSGTLTAGIYAHRPFTSRGQAATSLATALAAAMDAATAATVTVTYDTALLRYTIASTSASFSLDFTGTRAVLGAALGFSTSAPITGALTYTSTLPVKYAIKPSIDGRVGVLQAYKDTDGVAVGVADDGASYGVRPTTLQRYVKWSHAFEPKSAIDTLTVQEGAAGTWPHFFEHCATQPPIFCSGTHDGGFYLRLRQPVFDEQARTPSWPNADNSWTVNLEFFLDGYVNESAPVNSVAPVISGNDAIGDVLSCTTGTWSGAPVGYTYQWRRDGTNIGGATGSTYTQVAADIGALMTCIVTETSGGNTATSNTKRSTIINILGAKLGLLLDERAQSGSPVDSWADQSATAATLTAAGALRFATGATINSQPAPTSDGVNDWMGSGTKYFADFVNMTGGDIWIVHRPSSAPADQVNVYQAPAIFSVAAAHAQITYTTSGYRVGYSDGGFKTTAYIAASTGAAHLVNVRHDGTNLRIAVDATVGSNVACGTCTGSGANAIRLGADYTTTTWFTAGDFATVISCKGAPTSNERASVNALLAYKYGVTAP
jgi:hypothetical protein